MKLLIKQAILTGALIVPSLLFPSHTFGQTSGVIGVKFGFAPGYSTGTTLDPLDQAGVVAVTNWYNLLANVQDPKGSTERAAAINIPWTIPQDSAGHALSGVTLTPAGFNDGWNSGSADCANAKLLRDVWKINGDNGLTDAGHKHYATFTLANLPNSLYDVYVYVNDNNGNYWGNIGANSVIGGAGDIDTSGINGASTYTCGTQLHTAAGYNSPVNYVKLAGVETTSGGVILVTVVSQGNEFGVSGVELVPVLIDPQVPVLTQDTLPATAETVVGDQVVLTAAFSSSISANFQWQFVSATATNDIPGATSATLTLKNLQLTDSGSYRLKAINAANSAKVAYSTATPLVVVAPIVAGNVIVTHAGQTAALNAGFYPVWPIDTANDLIYGADVSATGSGDFGQCPGSSGFTTLLTDGDRGYGNNVKLSCGPGAGNSVTYALPANGFGYDLTNVTVYGGWVDNGRNEQKYQVLYSTVASPDTYVPLVSVDWDPANEGGLPMASRTMVVPQSGALAHNVANVMINFVTPVYPKHDWEGYDEITLGGTPSSGIMPALVQDVNPLAAEDVVGSSLILTASFSGATSYQWQKNGVNIAGATTPTLTLIHLQLTDTAGYSLVASNSAGGTSSRSCALIVHPAPAAVDNLVTVFASQGSDVLPAFSPTWSPSALNSSLIAGQNPPAGGYDTNLFDCPDNNHLHAAGGLPVLTDGNYGAITYDGFYPAFASCGDTTQGAGQFVTYTLLPATANGYNITNIQIAGGWVDNGRNAQQYTLSYATVDNPTNFLPLTVVSNNPTFNFASVTRATFTPAVGPIAANVCAIHVDFANPPGVKNGWSGYSEISVFGSASANPAPGIPPSFAAPVVSGTNLVMTGTGGTANRPYTWLSATNLLTPLANWTVVSSGVLSDTGALSNAIPMKPTQPASFFRLRMP